jgi:hypothetical protein
MTPLTAAVILATKQRQSATEKPGATRSSRISPAKMF